MTAKVKDKVAFLVEGKQAGIFEARNIPADQMDPLLGIGCPNIVYPYLRSNIADVITRAGFPPVHLAEINFEVFYQQRRQALAEQLPQPARGRQRSNVIRRRGLRGRGRAVHARFRRLAWRSRARFAWPASRPHASIRFAID